jgi:hypothetical protein
MSLCRSCTREIAPEEQVTQYVKVGACSASIMVCVWCFSGRRKPEPLAPAKLEWTCTDCGGHDHTVPCPVPAQTEASK